MSTVRAKHSHYHKCVKHLKYVDTYRVMQLFGVTDSAIAHAIKKLLCAGGRGVKDRTKDIQEAIDSLTRQLEMDVEDALACDADSVSIEAVLGDGRVPYFIRKVKTKNGHKRHRIKAA